MSFVVNNMEQKMETSKHLNTLRRCFTVPKHGLVQLELNPEIAG